MTNMEAILVRVSNRKYLDRSLTEDEISQLHKMIAVANQASGLRMQLITDHPEVFSSLRTSYGMFSGVRNMIALVGPGDLPNLKERCGYYGQKVLLGATTLGLGTCWVCGTYDRSKVPCQMQKGDVLCGVIVVGAGCPAARCEGKADPRCPPPQPQNLPLSCPGEWGMRPTGSSPGSTQWFWPPRTMNRQAYRFIYSNGSVRFSRRSTLLIPMWIWVLPSSNLKSEPTAAPDLGRRRYVRESQRGEILRRR